MHCSGVYHVLLLFLSMPASYFKTTNIHKRMVSTRSSGYSPTNTPSLDSRRQRWACLIRGDHYQPVIAEVLEQELPKYANSTVVLPSSFSLIMRECVLILASAPRVFAAALDGTLVHRLPNDVSLQREHATVLERAKVQPSIYVHLLADVNGIAPSANQYMEIRQRILEYMALSQGEDSDVAWMIDNVSAPPVRPSASAAGYRKYLWTSHRSHHHEQTLTRFCAGILKRWHEHAPSGRNAPFEFPPAECGYSINSHIRLAQHRNRQSSNYVMNLTEDVCEYMHSSGQFSQLFRMHQFVIYLIFRPNQASIAEIFCSGLLQVWVEDGGGLNAYPAGRSVASVRRLSQRQWAAHEEWIKENTKLNENMAIQKASLRNVVARLDPEMESDNENDGDDVNDLDYVPEELEKDFGLLRLE